MKKGKRKNLLIVFLLITALFSATFMSSFAVSQEEYDAAQKAAKEAKQATEAKRKEAKEAAKKAAAAVANFEEAEKELDRIAADIESVKVEISNKEAEIENTKADIAAKEAEIEEQNTALNNRLTAMYKNGNTGFVDVILNSENVEDLLSNVGMVHKILESDQNLLKKLQKDYKKLKELKEELEAQEAALVDQQIALEGKEIETEELKKAYQAEADKMHALQAQKEAEAAEMAADALAKQLEAERMIVDAGGQIDMAPGEYAWPTQSNWQLSDKYGWRRCPFHGKEFHNGLDIVLTSGTKGSPVYAIADGYITRASWYGGYGNCIQYAIGNGYSVLCGHLSGYNCSAGQYVTKGSVIGYIGSTGASTGPHLHFTVFQNGTTINPLSLY
jgi:murein DD-endopeptidase MepM/ murein hydrolase activator NlpD